MTYTFRSRRVPTYRKHKPSGQAVVTLDGKDHYLGKHGSDASKELYSRLIAQWLERGQQSKPDRAGDREGSLSVNEVILAYLRHSEDYYRDNPKEREKIRLSMRPLRQMYGRSDAANFGPLALKAVRTEMCETLARTTINHRIGVIKRLFKWAVANELVAPAVLEGLRAVEGLRRGRSNARETSPVKPVPRDSLERTLPFVNRHIRAMIEFQQLTGARPGEVCALRAADVDRSGEVWIYRPATHKNAYRGQERLIFIGPKAQRVLEPFLNREPDLYLFSPQLAMQERYVEIRRLRRTRIQPSQQNRRKARPKRVPGRKYDVRSYYHAVRRACDRAGVDHWHPNQLRHNAATDLRKEFGVELARVVLGHKTAFTTEIYAEADWEKAKSVIAKIG